MRINHNIAALNTHRQLGNANNAQSKSMEKLSSGLRINRAGDDAAGLAISEKMRAQVRGLDQASANAQDGISMISTAEGALSETTSILQRMRELAVQSSNDTNTDSDRGEIQKEMNQLTSEINRIGNTTEFNTQSLLKGKDAAVVETAAAQTTVQAGEKGIAAGAISSLTVNQKSVVGEASQAVVQGKTSLATGVVGPTAQTVTSVEGQQAEASALGITFKTTGDTATFNGTKIVIAQAASAGASNGSIVDSGGTGAARTVTFTIGTDADGKSLFKGTTVGELANFLKADAANFNSNTIPPDIEIVDPTGPSTGEPLVGVQDPNAVAVAKTYATSELTGGVTEARGESTFTLTNAINEAGDKVSVGGTTFTATTAVADVSKGEFNTVAKHSYNAAAGVTAATTVVTGVAVGDKIDVSVGGTTFSVDQAALVAYAGAGKTNDDLVNLIKNADNAGTKLSSVADVSINSAGKIEITDKTARATAVDVTITGAAVATLTGFAAGANAGAATIGALTGATADDQARSLSVAINASNLGTQFTAASTAVAGEVLMKENAGQATGEALAAVTTAGGGSDNQLIISDKSGKNLEEVTIMKNNLIADAGGPSTADTMSVRADTNGKLTIELAETSAYKNTAAEIEKAIQALGTVGGVDFSNYTVESTGTWDADEVGNNITKANGTLVGGLEEKAGDYSFKLETALKEGDILEIKGETFTAVESGAIASRGEINVSGGNINTQASELRNAIQLNDNLKQNFTVQGSGTDINLVEKKPTGTDLKASDLDVRATGTQGEYAMKIDEVLENGATFKLDGQEIKVSNKENHVGYDNGTAIKEAATPKDQATALATAINSNDSLKDKYTASVNDSGELVLKQTEKFTTDKGPEVSTTNSPLGKYEASFQVGANAGQSMTIEVEDMRSTALGIASDGTEKTVKSSEGKVASYVEIPGVSDGTTNKNTEFALDISTHEKATAAISVLNDAIEKVSAQRSNLGAYQNRLDHTINNLSTSSENLTAAESRIRDVDMAKEMMNQTKESILAQASQAMLAQANQKPQSVLQLLG